jgi:hypothetical protein
VNWVETGPKDGQFLRKREVLGGGSAGWAMLFDVKVVFGDGFGAFKPGNRIEQLGVSLPFKPMFQTLFGVSRFGGHLVLFSLMKKVPKKSRLFANPTILPKFPAAQNQTRPSFVRAQTGFCFTRLQFRKIGICKRPIPGGVWRLAFRPFSSKKPQQLSMATCSVNCLAVLHIPGCFGTFLAHALHNAQALSGFVILDGIRPHYGREKLLLLLPCLPAKAPSRESGLGRWICGFRARK